MRSRGPRTCVPVVLVVAVSLMEGRLRAERGRAAAKGPGGMRLRLLVRHHVRNPAHLDPYARMRQQQ